MPGITLPIVGAQQVYSFGRKEHFYSETDGQEVAEDGKWSEVSNQPSAPSFDEEPIKNYTFEASQGSDLMTNGQIRTLKGT